MSLAAIWDRFWWSLMLTIALGLLWLKLIDPIIPCISVGVIVCIAIGVAYFTQGFRAMYLKWRRELEVEEKARQELLIELD